MCISSAVNPKKIVLKYVTHFSLYFSSLLFALSITQATSQRTSQHHLYSASHHQQASKRQLERYEQLRSNRHCTAIIMYFSSKWIPFFLATFSLFFTLLYFIILLLFFVLLGAAYCLNIHERKATKEIFNNF